MDEAQDVVLKKAEVAATPGKSKLSEKEGACHNCGPKGHWLRSARIASKNSGPASIVFAICRRGGTIGGDIAKP